MKKALTLILIIMTFHSCGVDFDVLEYSSLETIDDGFDILLLFPENDSEINEGEIVSETESRVVFEWASKNNNNLSPYSVQLINLTSNDTITYESLESESAIILERNIRYSWSIAGISNSKSDTWEFLNIGPEINSFSPLPAFAISPVSGASISQTSTTVNLIWKSEDPDNDIVSHDLYFGETEDPEILDTDIIGSRYNDIPVEAGKTYYWKIVTKDSSGNESISEVFTFSVG